MARVKNQVPPSQTPNPAQMTAAIPLLRKRIAELKEIDLSKVEANPDHKIEALSNKINLLVGELFGRDSSLYLDYAAQLESISFFGMDHSLEVVRADYRREIEKAVTNLTSLVELFEERVGTISESSTGQQIYGPGAVYDFFRALSGVIKSATSFLFIADPYLDPQIFDAYLHECKDGVKVQLMVRKHAPNLRAAADRFATQRKLHVEIRHSAEFHDRVIFVNRSTAWVLGQSIKDAATKVTYLAPLSADIVALKLTFYDDLWLKGSAI